MRISLGERNVWKGRGSSRKLVVKKDEMYYVPLLKTLESLLQNETIIAEVCWCEVFNVYN